MNGNPIFDMLNTSQNSGMGILDMINGRFGNIGNAMKQLSMFLNNRGLNAEQIVRQNLQGKTFSNETIEQFKQFARQSGMSDEQIDASLRKVGIIK